MCSARLVAQYTQTGRASYYHDRFVGRKTASGIIFSNDSMHCAHRSLPFGTYLEVENLRNGRIVIVKVVDRGPYISGRIIDLSREAAERLDFIHSGITRVKITATDRRISPFRLDADDLRDYIPPEQAATLQVWRPNWEDIKAHHLDSCSSTGHWH